LVGNKGLVHHRDEAASDRGLYSARRSTIYGEGRIRRAPYYRFEFSEQHSDNLIRNDAGSLSSCAHQEVNHPNQKNDEFASLSVEPRKMDSSVAR